MKEIAILFKVPVVVFKFDRTFDNYKIVDVAFYGSGGLNQEIVCLLHTDDNKFDWLELGGSIRRRVHMEYERIYNSSFAEPSEYQRRIPAMDGDEEENFSQNSFMSDACGSGDSSSSSDDSEGEPPLPRATSAAASSGGADHVDDGDSNNEVNMSIHQRPYHQLLLLLILLQ